ncbi:hypothetical protein LTR70_007495 [Exophiala xenobiotica]|uniref:Uncharacterized protein n=1 Tax=Lithohypha guttulata TaxID=1690604 RepID=A0ABR0K4F1_9EURO|nr:hypothetical protein LTR24_007140 [Lithohypha guttulata]KAK5313654.1 hypothetical protein LTR70_007495 [Exophiala xenobiotica]
MERPNRWKQHRDFSCETYPLSLQEPVRDPEDTFTATGNSDRAHHKQQSLPHNKGTPGVWSPPRPERSSRQTPAVRSNHSTINDPAALLYEGSSDTDRPRPPFSASGSSENRSMYDDGRSEDDRSCAPSYASNVHNNSDTDRIAYPTLPTHATPSAQASGENPYFREAHSIRNQAARAFKVKAWLFWIDRRHFHEYAFFGRRFPESYQLPGYYHKPNTNDASQKRRHQDAFRRRFEGWDEDRFLDPLNGKVRKLFVQTVDEMYDVPNDTSWRRTYIRNISPWLLRLAWWPYSHMPNDAVSGSTTHKRTMKGIVAALQARVGNWDAQQWAQMSVYWLPACVGLLILASASISPSQ